MMYHQNQCLDYFCSVTLPHSRIFKKLQHTFHSYVNNTPVYHPVIVSAFPPQLVKVENCLFAGQPWMCNNFLCHSSRSLKCCFIGQVRHWSVSVNSDGLVLSQRSQSQDPSHFIQLRHQHPRTCIWQPYCMCFSLTAKRDLTSSLKFDHPTPLLMSYLHWLPIPATSDFKIL